MNERPGTMRSPLAAHVFLHGPRAMAWMAAVAVCIAAPQAHAYLDPGAGSMLLQILLGGLAGLGVLGKLYWHRLRSLFGARDARDLEWEETEAGPREGTSGAGPGTEAAGKPDRGHGDG